jgi:hypothetical protein
MKLKDTIPTGEGVGGLTVEDETDKQRTLLHSQHFPAKPIFDENGELCGVHMPPDGWHAVFEAMHELLKLTKPIDRIVTRYRASDDRKFADVEIGIVRGN